METKVLISKDGESVMIDLGQGNTTTLSVKQAYELYEKIRKAVAIQAEKKFTARIDDIT